MGILGLMAVVLLAGCAYNEPKTVFGVDRTGKISFADGKDNDLQVAHAEGEWGGQTGRFVIDNLTLSNNASRVIKENVQQMLAFAEQQRAANEGIRAAFDGLTSLAGQLTGMIREFVPLVQATTSNTTTVLRALAEINARLDAMGVGVTMGAATTQPAK